jgi:cell division protein FtsN
MTRDYKHRKRKSGRDNKSASATDAILPFLTGLSIGLFVAFLVYLKGLTYPGDGNVATTSPAPEATAEKPEASTESTATTPQFDFYKILPSMKVNVSEWEAEDKQDSGALTEDKGVYILQVGSFEQFEAADEVKARLALLGISADIQRVVINGKDIRHRVRVGPYREQKKLNETRQRLLANGLDFMLLKLNINDVK